MIRMGWTHEINPRFGHSGFSLDKIDGMLAKVAALVDGKDLNALMQFPPTAENLAVWLLVRCPGFVQWIEVGAYGDLLVCADRSGLRSEMVAEYLAGDNILELTV